MRCSSRSSTSPSSPTWRLPVSGAPTIRRLRGRGVPPVPRRGDEDRRGGRIARGGGHDRRRRRLQLQPFRHARRVHLRPREPDWGDHARWTTPVFTSPGKMQFVLPSKYTDPSQLPAPKDGVPVKVTRVQGEVYAALRFAASRRMRRRRRRGSSAGFDQKRRADPRDWRGEQPRAVQRPGDAAAAAEERRAGEAGGVRPVEAGPAGGHPEPRAFLKRSLNSLILPAL